ncbi:transcriptional regulator GcvA [Geminicoccus harenae]|uniref:transcriptional regulator GcvA n=1 Tax=Geminicoccus harenae TaxID=2498453 RepID=UPI00168B7607|nr:transcriptional regulator GcvA [Geminicoccus harenae]
MARLIPGLGMLRTFEAAARHLNFTRAAEELDVTPAAVSAQIRSLEDVLGVRLLWRTSRSVRLTEAGEVLLEAVSESLDRIGQAVDRIRAPSGRPSLKISTGFSFAAKWLVPRLERFRRHHPDLDVRLDVSERLADFLRDEVDVAIRFGAGVYPGLRSDRLFDEQVFPVCSPRLLHGDPPLRAPDDLRHHALIHEAWQSQDGTWPDWRMWLLAAGLEDIDLGRGLHVQQSALAIQAAVDGQGVALGNTSLVADDLAAGRLVQPFALSLNVPGFAYYLVAPRRSADRPVVRAFRDWLMAEVRGGPARN